LRVTRIIGAKLLAVLAVLEAARGRRAVAILTLRGAKAGLGRRTAVASVLLRRIALGRIALGRWAAVALLGLRGIVRIVAPVLRWRRASVALLLRGVVGRILVIRVGHGDAKRKKDDSRGAVEVGE
jgi:hypothetical protein